MNATAWLCPILLLLQFCCAAQSGNLRFEHITVEKELVNNTTIRVIQDRRGFIWIGTYNGLCKYDGYGFQTFQFDPTDSTSLCGNLIYNLWKAPDGKIWLAARDTGLYRFDRKGLAYNRYIPARLGLFVLVLSPIIF